MFRAFERRLGFVPRWTVIPHNNKQSVAEHSFYVALYTDKICTMLELSDTQRAKIVSYALRHDMAETIHGDIPSPAKRRLVLNDHAATEEALFIELYGSDADYYDYRHATDYAHSIVKLADRMEAAMWLTQEVAMGNSQLGELAQDLRDQTFQVARKLFDVADAQKFLEWIAASANMEDLLK